MNQDTQDHDIGLLKRWPALGLPCTQQQLADLVGVTQSAISRHVTAGHIPSSATALEQLRANGTYQAINARYFDFDVYGE